MFAFGNGGFQLSGPADPVAFDLNSNGFPESTGWTAAGEETAFLALDLNKNGIIDTGRELFGNHTRLFGPNVGPGVAANGFEALALYDAPAHGGNGDGFIDEGDGIYPSLLLWTDRNHNGRSEPEELEHLDEAGLVRISVDYHESRRRDRWGNLFKYKGQAWRRDSRGRERPVQTYDVFFVRNP